jgi:hypothetical protein
MKFSFLYQLTTFTLNPVRGLHFAKLAGEEAFSISEDIKADAYYPVDMPSYLNSRLSIVLSEDSVSRSVPVILLSQALVSVHVRVGLLFSSIN